MNSRKWLLSIAASLLVAVSATVTIIWACNSSPRFACSQTAWLAKIVTSVVVVPPGASTATVNMTLVPNVRWSVSPAGSPIVCPQPTAADILLTITFPGLAPQTVTVPAPVPTVQGPQPAIPTSFSVTLPPGGVPAAATVAGQYRVTFTGAGGGLVIGMGDAEICFVEPSPADDQLPRLDMALMFEEDKPFQFCQRGDTAATYYLLSNNDPEHSVSLNLTAQNTQIAFLPGGDAPNVYSVSGYDPNGGGDLLGSDNFPVSFGDTPLPVGDPMDPNDPVNGPASSSVVLGPFEQTFIKVNTGIHGMCAAGSCSEQLVKAQGDWFLANDPGAPTGPALACAQTAIWVDNDGPAKTPLCTMEDRFKASPTSQCAVGPTQYGDDPHHTTTIGRDDPNFPIDNFFGDFNSTLVAPLQGENAGQPNQGMDIINFPIEIDENGEVIPAPTNSFFYYVDCTNLQTGNQTRNMIQVNGFDHIPAGQTLDVPFFEWVNGTILNWTFVLDILPGGESIELTFFEGQELIFDREDFFQFCEDPPFFINCDRNTCRSFTKILPECSDTLGVGTSPAAPHVAGITALLGENTPNDFVVDSFFDVFFEISETPAPFGASLLQGGPSTIVMPEMGGAGTPLQVSTSAADIPVAPGTLLQKIFVENPDACGPPQIAYIALRKMPPPPAPDGDQDGIPDDIDNAPGIPNPDQSDLDGDGVGDVADNAVHVFNPGQEDSDNDGTGDVVDADFDNDGTVTIGDFNVLRSLFGTTNTRGDFDADGVVGVSDVNIFIALFGRTIDRNTDPLNP